ncbi:MAG: SDR family NAD(P)-dependent oxidoreductase [Defluviitaleaceae bacterium]|nr:SDR family NAD(P)-dependent oxidoreductase [Defluviitaleaceae bacterium]
MRLDGKRFLITGASSGLGLAIVKRLLKVDGVQIFAVARNITPLEKMPVDRVFTFSADVARPKNIENMLDEAIKQMGGVDCVIANAGFGYYEQFYGKDYRHIERIFQTNVLSPLYTLQRFLAKTDGKVSFVVISSMLGKMGLSGMSLYCATKYALDGFADSYKFEKPDRLHYMTVYPIGLKTNFWRRLPDNIPLPRPLQSADSAACAVIKGLQNEKRAVYTSPPSKIALRANGIIPFLIPSYQLINKKKFDKWRKSIH